MLVEPVSTNSRLLLLAWKATQNVWWLNSFQTEKLLFYFFYSCNPKKSIAYHKHTAAVMSVLDNSCFILPVVAASASCCPHNLKKADWNTRTAWEGFKLNLGKMDAPDFRLWNLINPAVLHTWSSGSQFNINGRKIIPHQCRCVGEITQYSPVTPNHWHTSCFLWITFSACRVLWLIIGGKSRLVFF